MTFAKENKMPLNSSVDLFHEKLIRLADAGAKIGLAAASAMANPDGCSHTMMGMANEEIDDVIRDMRHLTDTLHRIGQKSR